MKKLGFILTAIFALLVAVYFFLSPPGDEFVEKDLYSQIIERGFINVGVNPNSKPFAYYDSSGDLKGYDIDLANKIAGYILRENPQVKFVPISPSNRLIKASTGDVDIVISTVTITPLRQEVVNFSLPYDHAGQAVLVKSNSSIKTLSDLSGNIVGVIFGTTAEKNMQALVPTAKVLGFKSYDEAYKALKLGKINAITSDDTILSSYAINDNEIKLLPKRYSYEPYGIAFKKGDSTAKLKEILDFAIRDLQKQNYIYKLRQKWNVL